MERAKIIVVGAVQGVGYRHFTVYYADRLGLTGTVRNRWRGDVEIIAEGDKKVLEKFIHILEKGPSFAHVDNVTVEWLKATGKFNTFYVER